MHNLPLLKRIYYRYLGYFYWFTHKTSTRRLLGMRVSTIIKLLAILFVLAAWLYKWGTLPLSLALLLTIWIFLAYWRAARSGYYEFVPDKTSRIEYDDQDKLMPYERIACIATGVFSVQEWEKNLLFREAAYWQVPRGDHALMVTYQPHKYLYQFFNMTTLQELRRGWLLYGSSPIPALSISHESIWGPEFSQIQFSIFGSARKAAAPKVRTIFLSFPGAEAERVICHNIMTDVQRHSREEQIREETEEPPDLGRD